MATITSLPAFKLQSLEITKYYMKYFKHCQRDLHLKETKGIEFVTAYFTILGIFAQLLD